MTAKNFEDFKKNLTQVERCILDDSAEPTSNIKIAESWLQYVQNNSASPEEASVILKEWLPKIVKAILTRKYDWQKTDFQFVSGFLENLMVFISDFLREDHEGVYLALKDLFDTSLPFYSKYCPLAYEKTETENNLPLLLTDVPPLNIDTLVADDCIDCQDSSGSWSVAQIMKFSDFRTEFEVSFFSDGHSEWLSLENHRHRIACLGHKTSPTAAAARSSGTTTTSDLPAPGNSAFSSGSTIPLPAEHVIDPHWLDTLQPGSLLDARDPSRVWYQACVMEIKYEEICMPVSAFETAPAVPVVVSATASAGKESSDHISSSIDEMYGTSTTTAPATTAAGIQQRETAESSSGAIPAEECSSDPVPEEPSTPIGTTMTAPPSTDVCATSVEMDVPTSNNAVVEDNTAIIDLTDSYETTTVPEITGPFSHNYHPTAPAGTSNTPKIRTLLRIAYIGLPQSNDEWLDTSCDRIEKLNTRSCGRRGKVIGVREEIYHLVRQANANLQQQPEQQQQLYEGGLGNSKYYADKHEESFQTPLYLHLINVFGEKLGFETIRQKLEHEIAEKLGDKMRTTVAVAGREVQPTLIWTSLLTLITAIGLPHRVLSHSFLSTYAPLFLSYCSTILNQMSLSDIRETPVEALEAALTSIEQIAVAHLGRTEQMGEILEPLRFTIAVQCLNSPFLNRRLGGLKILSELIRHGENTQENPLGFKVTKTLMSNNIEDITYRVVPVLFHYNLHTLCEKLRSLDALEHIFIGNSSHESLIARVHPVVTALAGQRCLCSRLLTAICTAGFVENKPEALRCLSHVIGRLPLDDVHVHHLLEIVRKRDPTQLTVSVVEIVAALALRCRDELHEGSVLANNEAKAAYLACTENNDITTATTAADAGYKMEVEGDSLRDVNTPDISFTDPTSAMHLRSVFAIHTEALLVLWGWTTDTSNVPDTVVATCMEKLESIVSLGTSHLSAQRTEGFPWAMHWYRLYRLVVLAMEGIKHSESVFRALKLVQLVVTSWPHVGNTVSVEVQGLPFTHACRGDVMAHLQKEFDIIHLVTSAVVQLKSRFIEASLTTAHSTSWGKSFTTVEDFSSPAFLMSVDAEANLNSLKISSARCGYLSQLSQALDFLHMTVRCGETLLIPYDTLAAVFDEVIAKPITPDEVDTAVSFLQRVVNRLHDSTIPTPTVPATTTTSSNSGSSTINTTELPRRSAVTTRSALLDIFTHRLCAPDGFVRSKFYSTKAAALTEKWFRWLNSDISYQNDTESDETTRKAFRSTNNPEDLVGIDVFPHLILYCYSDRVAANLVKFLVALPSTLPYWSRNCASAVLFRRMLLSRCMHELSTNTTTTPASTPTGNTSVHISRALLFLDGILEESAASSGGEFAQHGTLGRGTPVVFHTSSTNKGLKCYDGEVICYLNETIHDLFTAVAQRFNISVHQTKLFRLGKEISYKTDHAKTISQLRDINSAKERLMVSKICSPKSSTDAAVSVAVVPADATLAPNTSTTSVAEVMEVEPLDNTTTTTAATATDITTSAVDKEGMEVVTPDTETTAPLLAALELAQSSEYFDLLFGLLQSSTGAVCDRLWGLLTRIPTSASQLHRWVTLDCNKVSNLLLNFDHTAWNHISSLLYQLQVIEMLLQPAVSEIDFEVQCRFIKDIDHDQLRVWVNKFTQKGGLSALCTAFSWIQKATMAFLCSPATSMPVGVTEHLLQQASTLVTKLMRAYIMRISVAQHPVCVSILTSVLQNMHNQDDKGSTKSSTGSNSAPATDMCIDSDVVLSTSTAGSELLSSEWGWRVSFQSSDSLLVDTLNSVDVAQLQCDIVSMMISLRKLSETDYFNPASNAEGTVRTIRATQRDVIVATLDSLLVQWIAVYMINTEVKVDPQKILMELVLGDVSIITRTLPSRCTTTASRGVPVEWFVRTVGMFLRWTSAYTVLVSSTKATITSDTSTTTTNGSSTNNSNGSTITTSSGSTGSDLHGNQLGSELMLLILTTRPTLQHCHCPTTSTTGIDYKPLFALAAILLDESSGVMLQLPIEKVRETYTQMFTELQEYHKTTLSTSTAAATTITTSTVLSEYLESTIMLFVALCLRDPSSNTLLSKPATMDFLLQDCLGLVGLAQTTLPIVCIDDIEKKHLYRLLKDLVQRLPSQALSVYRTISTVHTQVPPPIGWDVRPQRESRSYTGYVGLCNLGSTCYMNSLLQVLYMNPKIREYIINDLHFDTENIDELRNNIAFQLRKLFYMLKYSQKKFIVPTDWTFSFKDENGVNPMNVMLQQDAQEFLQTLAERFEHTVQEKLARLSGNTGETTPIDIIHRSFGGLLCNQMFQTSENKTTTDTTSSTTTTPCTITNTVREIREQNESFVCISLTVKGCDNLQQSLEKFVEGEQITGYQWQEGQPRVSITKRQCIAKLSDTLIFHLKRFELNFDTFRREKVNDSFAFPQKLNMFPYTKYGLEVNEGIATSTSDNAMEVGMTEEDCAFELTGVVVHTGTADSGHYYAYIKEPSVEVNTTTTITTSSTTDKPPAGRWLEFNDAEVSVFSEALLEAECFGGTTKVHDLYSGGDSVVTTEMANPKSAYMLIYSRITKKNAATSTTTSPVVAAETSLSAPLTPSVNSPFSAMDVFRAQIALENANHSLSIRVLNEHHLSFYNHLLNAMHQHAIKQNITLTGTQVTSYTHFVTRYMAHTAHLSVFQDACKNILTLLLDEKTKALHSSASRKSSLGSSPGAPPLGKRLYGTISSPSPTTALHVAKLSSNDATGTATEADQSVLPPTPPSMEEDKENHLPMPPPPSPPAITTTTTAATHSLDTTASTIPATAPGEAAETLSATDSLLSAWLSNLDDALQGLYAPKEEVRRALAEVVLRVFEASCAQHGAEVFSRPELEIKTGLLSTSFGAGMLAAVAAAGLANNRTIGDNGNSMYPTADVAVAEPMDEDADLLLAIKMSQEASGMMVVDEPVPTEAALAGDAEVEEITGPSDSTNTMEEVEEEATTSAKEEVVAPPIPAIPPPPSSTPPAVPPTPPELLAAQFLLALTDDNRMQLIAEHWRKSQSVLWLLLEIARLGSAQRTFLLKREIVAQLVDAVLGDQCPLNGMVYATGSRRRAPSSYVTIVSGRDDTLPFVAKNIPDWSHLMELLTALVCHSDSLQLGQSLGEISLQCLQTKTLYNTIFRQARYTTIALPMLVHLCYENQVFSNLILESLCDELGQCKEGDTAHIFQAIDRLLNMSDTLAHSRNFQLFGGGDFNLLEIMKITKDQIYKHRFVCVFIRSFIALAEKSQTLRSVISIPASKISIWAPWMLKFFFRFIAKCNQEQQTLCGDFNTLSPERNQVNQAIRAMVGPTAEPRSVSFNPTPTVCIPTTNSSSAVTPSMAVVGAVSPPLPSPTPAGAGPFLRVYGEDALTESTQTWLQRAERTFQGLQSLIVSLGGSPDELIPVDTFDEDATISTSNTTGMSTQTSSAPIGAIYPQLPYEESSTGRKAPVNLMQLADGMTDEELAQILEGGGLGVD